ncbi:MAG: cell surface protein SprA [Flavobacteriales bacterium]|nr:cell surface protein SprA [Flavobacteriales bacterium]
MRKLFSYYKWLLFVFIFSKHIDIQAQIIDTSLYFPFQNNQSGSIFLNEPSNFNLQTTYDISNNNYIIQKKIGGIDMGIPSIYSFEQFQEYTAKKSIYDYWKLRTQQRTFKTSTSLLNPKLYVPGKAFDKIFGGNSVDIRPQGSAELIFGLKINRLDNPSLPEEQRRTTSFDFQEKIQMNVIGKIGDKLKLTTNFNTESTFDFENQMKLEYTGNEDEIIKKIEVGNVSLPLNGSLITGSQSLFGFKTQLQFGRTTITGILSQQKSTTSEIEVSGGAQTSEFDIYADQYEANKHFFLAHYFKEKYDQALEKLPYVNSQVNITKLEVWITNKTGTTNDTRNIVAFLDLAENQPNIENLNNQSPIINDLFWPAYNEFPVMGNQSTNPPYQFASNDLYQTLIEDFTQGASSIRNINDVNSLLQFYFQNGVEYEKLERARKLSESEYTLNNQLGFISLNQALNNDEILAVAFQYTVGDKTFQVGELTTSGPNAPEALIVKLLKGTSFSPTISNWDLMMKNIYSIGAYQMSRDGFVLDVMYENTEESGAITNYIGEGNLEGIPLIKLLNLDNLNQQMNNQSDGVFDFIEGITAKSSNGRIIFPVREPFGDYLANQFNDFDLAKKYSYQILYDSTLTIAQQYPELNKYRLKGSYKSTSGAEIRLNAMNVPEGSVTVTAGSQKLVENQDYTVDYMLGRVTIINEGILSAGVPIKISLENNSMFGIQNKTLVGLHADYEINKDFIIGATMLNLTERPYTQKINTGEEPISNTIWGMDANYQTEAPIITKLIDKIPLIETKEKSRIIATAEFAHLIPGHHRAVGKQGVSYIDDFEATRTSLDIKNPGAWYLSSIPEKQLSIFQNSDLNEDLRIGFNRAKLAWYTIDPLFFRNISVTPPNINQPISLLNGNTIEQQSFHYSREVLETEVFPNKDPDLGSQITNLAILDLAYYPQERGPNNYSTDVDANGNLDNPHKNWAGIMRKLETNDFESANIEFIEFWMMDPFNKFDGDSSHFGGDMYLHLGNISEDVLKDGYKSFENGLPTSATIENVDTTVWGRVPTNFSIVEAFDNDPNSRQYQDVGLDGLRDSEEILFFDTIFLKKLEQDFGPNSQAYLKALADPSSDNFHYYRGTDYDNQSKTILERYKDFNNTEGNSVTTENSPESYPTAATSQPNTEDLNRDYTLSETENYYQYKIRLQPEFMVVGQNYIADVLQASVPTENGSTRDIKWYQFRVPVYKPDKVLGSISDFKSIRFMRLVFSDFKQPIICRLATFELVRGEWRRYNFDLSEPGEYIPLDDQEETIFDVSSVNIEENGNRSPINYVLPPGIEQEVDQSTTTLRQQNEQSLVLKVCDLKDGDSRAAYKITDIDVRAYKRIKMFVHAESGGEIDDMQSGDLSCFIRLGTDFTSNFYEYEIPLTPTRWGSTYPNEIWPNDNEIDIAFEIFQLAKQERNFNTSDFNTPYIKYSSGGKITVVGNPNLAQVKTIMLGIRNPKKKSLESPDDGESKCGQIWVNELRLTDFDEYGGWAANSRLTTRLADLGNLTISGNMSTVGFGSIEKKVNERQKYNAYQYDLSSTFDLGKFFPKDLGVKIPMYIGGSTAIKNPQYNPLDPDILFKTSLQALGTEEEKDSLRYISQDYVSRNSINFTNVRKTKIQKKGEKVKKQKVYDLENFTVSYSKNETYIRNINTEYNRTINYRGALTYNFNTQPKNIKPFSKIKFPKSPYFRLIRDFNFNNMPKSFSFRTDLDRNYNETKLRNLNNSNMIIYPTYNKFFNWNRMYDFKYDLTRTLKIDFTVNNKANIDEPIGKISKSDPLYEAKIDTIWQNFWKFGRSTSYSQSVGVNYQAPLNKIPIFNFISLNTRYNGNYDWTTGSLALRNLGHTIQNSNTKQYNIQVNMTTLYNKVPYFKKLNQNNRNRRSLSRNNERSRNKNNNEENKTKNQYEVFQHLTRFLLAVKNISINYSQNAGTFLPGYMNQPHFLGQEWATMSPGLPFVFGSQKDIRENAGNQGWITRDTTLNTLYKKNFSSNLTLRSTIEPIKQFRIEITANKMNSQSSNEYFKWNSSDGIFSSYNPTEAGNYTISFVSWRTAFSIDNDQNQSSVFSKFRGYRIDIAKQLAARNPNFNSNLVDSLTGFPVEYENGVLTGGYGPTSQEVIIPAFLAAYGGYKPLNSSLTAFPSIPMPNWRITYDGLVRIPLIKKKFKTFSVAHAYRSNYSVGSYQTNLNYIDGDEVNLNNMSYHVQKEISQVTINEQFSPLFKLDMAWKNSLLTKLEIKRTRTLALSLTNNQLTETGSKEYVFGLGYRIKDLSFRFFSGGKGKKMTSDLDLRLDFNIMNNKTVIRKIIEDIEQITMGQQVIKINFAADYVVNQRLNVKVFYDKVITNPFISTTFPGAITNAGFSLRFTLAG